MIKIKHPERGEVIVESMPLYGLERAAGLPDVIPDEGDTVEFKLYDDDGGYCYGGTLTDDVEGTNQLAALRYGETDYGATLILVKRNGKWIQEIG